VVGAPRLAQALATVVVATVGAMALAGAAAPAPNRTYTIRVDARDFSFSLSRRTVPAGSTVRFVVKNRGNTVHDFVVATKKRTRLLSPGRSQTITVTFPKKGTFKFLCSVSGHARLGMKGIFGVSTKPPPPAPPPPPIDTSNLVSLTSVGSFDRPVLVTAPSGDTRRQFVVEQRGTVRVVRDGEILPAPFLDVSEQVKLGNEPGLLSLAFSPDYADSGLFYVIYNARSGNGDLRLVEFRRSASDPDQAERYSERVVFTIVKPWENHNGGMLQFGPDGYLYVTVGDGDSGVLNPPGAFAQRRDNLLGSILRIDPRSGSPYSVPTDNPFVGIEGVRPEIWAYGLRNPWRSWIDPETGAMFISDTGNARREEVDFLARDQAGANFGWPCFEGTLPFDETATCDGALPPLLEYARDGGACAVIGGVVARDPRIPALAGRYLYGDYCSGKVTAVAVENGTVASSGDLGISVPELTSFGVDGLGRIYVTSFGGVYRLDPKPTT
jgi:glucose/arabinose dehydrogenase